MVKLFSLPQFDNSTNEQFNNYFNLKIAILSMTNISVSNATGSLLSRLFKGWKKEDIIQICKYQHSDEVADQYQNIIPFYDFMEKQRASSNWFLKLPAAILRRVFFPLLFFYGNQNQILKALQKFKPQILYLRVVAKPFYYLKLACFLKEKLDIPLVLHFMDDYDLHLQLEAKWNPIRAIENRLYSHYLKRTIALSDLNYAISESMAEAFKIRYDVPFKVAHNGIAPTEYQHFRETNYPKANPKRILWAGAIEVSKDNQIVNKIAQAIENINTEIPCQFLLNVPKNFVEPAQKLQSKFKTIEYQTYQPLAIYKELLASSQVLIIARNFDDKTRAYTQFSFHNKLPDFLASGTPVLAIGPDWDNTVKLFKKYKFGQVVTENDQTIIESKIREILNANAQNEDESRKAFEVFNMEKIRSDFQDSLINIAHPKNKK
jgi:hypothetical protein